MFENLEDAFSDLDKNEYKGFTKALATYMNALIESGFGRREAFRLVEGYAKLIYELSLEEAIEKSRLDNASDSSEDADTP